MAATAALLNLFRISPEPKSQFTQYLFGTPMSDTGSSWHSCYLTYTVLQFGFVCASVVSYVAFVLSLFLSHLSFFWRLGKAVLRDSGTCISWGSSLYSFVKLLGQVL